MSEVRHPSERVGVSCDISRRTDGFHYEEGNGSKVFLEPIPGCRQASSDGTHAPRISSSKYRYQLVGSSAQSNCGKDRIPDRTGADVLGHSLDLLFEFVDLFGAAAVAAALAVEEGDEIRIAVEKVAFSRGANRSNRSPRVTRSEAHHHGTKANL